MSRPTIYLGAVALAFLTLLPITPVTPDEPYCDIDTLPVQQGPSFCRSGAGHPVHGRLWCLDKGFGLGETVWRRIELPGARLNALPQQAIDGRRLPPERVTEILGQEIIRQLFGQADRRLDRGTLGGFWRGGHEQGVLVLEVVDGATPVAELTDLDVDGSVDAVIITDPELGAPAGPTPTAT